MRSKLFSKFGLFLKVEFGKLDFGAGKRTLQWRFFGAYSSVYRKRHYKISIVACLTNATKKNATKKNATIVFVFQPKVEFAKLDFKKESNLLNNFERMPRA